MSQVERFATEEEARARAKAASKQYGDTRYVVESAPRDAGIDPSLRFAVDTDGFTRSWERSIATYENGREDG